MALLSTAAVLGGLLLVGGRISGLIAAAVYVSAAYSVVAVRAMDRWYDRTMAGQRVLAFLAVDVVVLVLVGTVILAENIPP